MKDDRRDRAGVAEGGTLGGILADEEIARFQEEHDEIAAELGAYLGLFSERWSGERAVRRCDDSEAVRNRILSWCTTQLRNGQKPPDAVRGLRMAVTTFSDDQLMIFAEGLILETRARTEQGAVTERLR